MDILLRKSIFAFVFFMISGIYLLYRYRRLLLKKPLAALTISFLMCCLGCDMLLGAFIIKKDLLSLVNMVDPISDFSMTFILIIDICITFTCIFFYDIYYGVDRNINDYTVLMSNKKILMDILALLNVFAHIGAYIYYYQAFKFLLMTLFGTLISKLL